MERFFGLVRKEFIHFSRDPAALALLCYHFTACIVLCGYSYVVDAKHLPTAIYDMNRSPTSRDLVQRFVSTEYFDLDTFTTSMNETKERLASRKARVGLIIPPDFSKNLEERRPASIQLISDASDSNQSGQAIGFAKRIVGTFNERIIMERLQNKGIVVSSLPGIDNQLRVLYNQERKSVYYMVILHVVVAGLIGGLILTSVAVVREKERGTIDQLFVTPTHSWEMLLSKMVAPFVICMFATFFSFLVVVWFGVPCRGSLFTFFSYMGFFLIGSIGLGILAGSICKNMLQAILLCFLLWFASIFLAGVLTPRENMLPFLQVIAQGMPTTHFMIAASGIFQKGNGFSILWPEAVKLLLTGFILVSIGCGLLWRQWKQ